MKFNNFKKVSHFCQAMDEKIDYQRLRKIVRDEREPNLEEISLISDCINVPADCWLLGVCSTNLEATRTMHTMTDRQLLFMLGQAEVAKEFIH